MSHSDVCAELESMRTGNEGVVAIKDKGWKWKDEEHVKTLKSRCKQNKQGKQSKQVNHSFAWHSSVKVSDVTYKTSQCLLLHSDRISSFSHKMSALGLGDYGSSDEEGDQVVTPVEAKVCGYIRNKAPQGRIAANEGGGQPADHRPDLDKSSNDKGMTRQIYLYSPSYKYLIHTVTGKVPPHTVQVDPESATTFPIGPVPDASPSVAPGPALGPAPGPAAMPTDMSESFPTEDGQPPASPYTTRRTLVRNLTMPPVPNFDIPPSPPGSPPPATTAKFDRFLELKKKGVHFNERLQQSAALRNPSLLAKLMDFAGISQQDQYASALPDNLAVPTTFPDWAYADNLVKEHARIANAKDEESKKKMREALDFVPAKQLDNGSHVSSGKGSVGKPGDKSESRRSRFDQKQGRDDRRGGHIDRDRRNGRRSRSPR